MGGVDVHDEVQQMKLCWQNKDWTCVATEIKAIIDTVNQFDSQYKSLFNLTAFLAKVETVVTLEMNVNVTYHTLKHSFELLQPPTTVQNAQQSAQLLGQALQQMSQELTSIDHGFGPQVAAVAHTLEKEVAMATVLDGKLQHLLVSAVDIMSHVQAARQCWEKQPQDLECVANELQAIVKLLQAPSVESNQMA